MKKGSSKEDWIGYRTAASHKLVDTYMDNMREGAKKLLNNQKTNTMNKKEVKEIILANNVVFLAKTEEEFEIIKAWYK